MSIGVWQLVLILFIVFIFFGAGKLPKVISELKSGIKALRDTEERGKKSKKTKNL